MSDTVTVDLAQISGELDPTDIALDVALGTGTSDLVVKCDNKPLPEVESLLILVPRGRSVRLVAADFVDTSDVRWITSASPRISDLSMTWERIDPEGWAVDVSTAQWPYSDFLPVTIVAQAEGQTREKKIHIKIRTEDPMPGGLRHGG